LEIYQDRAYLEGREAQKFERNEIIYRVFSLATMESKLKINSRKIKEKFLSIWKQNILLYVHVSKSNSQ
jgi:hypothetical protein